MHLSAPSLRPKLQSNTSPFILEGPTTLSMLWPHHVLCIACIVTLNMYCKLQSECGSLQYFTLWRVQGVPFRGIATQVVVMSLAWPSLATLEGHYTGRSK